MERVILIKYGELTTKKGNRNFFVNTLYNNIKEKLKELEEAKKRLDKNKPKYKRVTLEDDDI